MSPCIRSYVMQRIISSIFAVLVMALAAPTASANGADGALRIPAGQDHFRVSDAGFDLQLPPDFFGPGSEPFDGTIICGGQEDFGTDTIIERKSDIILPPPPSSDTIPIEIIELQLVSCQPIVVNHNDGSQEQWNVQIDLSPIIPPPGQMTIERIDKNGGTFDAQLPVQPRFIFIQVGGEEITEPGTIVGDNPLEHGSDSIVEQQPIIWESEFNSFVFNAQSVPWSLCLTPSVFCPGPIALASADGWMNLVLPVFPGDPDEKACEFPLPNGGLVVLPTPHNPNPSSDKAQSPDQLRRAADRLEAKGFTAEADRLRLIAEAIETIQQTCKGLNDIPPFDENHAPPDLPPLGRGRSR